MRTIKFRGKSIYGKREWIYGCILQFKHQFYIVPDVEKIDLKIYRVIPDTVGQFTGLIDKNGKEIYEGDILSNSFMDNKKGKNGIVSFKEHCFCVECEELFRPIGNDLGWANMNENKWYGEIEVIGNVHDNPELIQQR